MTAAAGYVAVGGQRSQVVVKDIKTDWRAATCIGGAINNCVHVSAHVGITHPRLFVCNNDETTKIFQLPTMEHVATIRSTTAVNGVAVSPDGRYMVIVGDTNEVLLYSIRGGGFGDHYYERIALLTTNKDAGFSCSWDQTSTKFAVGCQDACVCVWDVRSVKKLAQIPSTQASGRGAVRSVKFTRYGSIDLLAFTEVSYLKSLNLINWALPLILLNAAPSFIHQ